MGIRLIGKLPALKHFRILPSEDGTPTRFNFFSTGPCRLFLCCYISTMMPAQPNRSIMDGMAVLQALCGSRTPVGSRQLARDLGLEPTRVNRLLKTLAALGMAKQTNDRKYLPGPGVHVLASQSLYASGLLHASLPVLEALPPPGFMVALGVLWRRHVSYIYHGHRDTPASEAIGTRGLFPAEASGLGHVLLAQKSPREITDLYGAEASELDQQLQTVRKAGWALVKRLEKEKQTATLAVPLGNPVIAAIGLAGNISHSDIETLLPKLQQAAQSIEDKL